MLKQQKRARAAAWISACVLCIVLVLSFFGSVSASADEARNPSAEHSAADVCVLWDDTTAIDLTSQGRTTASVIFQAFNASIILQGYIYNTDDFTPLSFRNVKVEMRAQIYEGGTWACNLYIFDADGTQILVCNMFPKELKHYSYEYGGETRIMWALEIHGNYDYGCELKTRTLRNLGFSVTHPKETALAVQESYETGWTEGILQGRQDGVNILAKMEAVRAWEILREREDSIGELDVNAVSRKTWTQIIREFNDEAYRIGNSDGYRQGFGEGQTDALNSTNTLKTVILTIFTAPGHLIDSILDFNLLGINIASFVKTIITLAVVALIAFFIVKVIRG